MSRKECRDIYGLINSKLGGKSQGGRRDRNQPYRESPQRECITLDRTRVRTLDILGMNAFIGSAETKGKNKAPTRWFSNGGKLLRAFALLVAFGLMALIAIR